MSDFRRYYKESDYVFLTMVTYARNPILIQNINLVRNSFKTVKYKYHIIAGIVLKDHIHIIIKPQNALEIPQIIASFKSNFSRNFQVNEEQTKSQIERREKGIWQRKYYDHIIRNENDLNRHIDYIHYNSYKHYKIVPKDWEYSSFKKFVSIGMYEIDWCNYEDRNNIIDLDLE